VSAPVNILILEDRAEDVALLVRELQRGQQHLTWYCAQNEPEFLAALGRAPDLILADYTIPGFGALPALELLQRRKLDIPLIVVSGSINEESAVECIQRGAADYLLKDRLTRLVPAIQQALERQRATAALHTSEERFRVIFQRAPIGIVLGDLRGRVAQANRAFQDMLGYSATELIGMPFTEFTHPDDRQQLSEAYAELIAGQREEYFGERRYIHKQGHMLWGRPSASLVRGENGQPEFAIITVEDITERRAVDAANARLAAIVDSSDDAIIGKTLDGTILSWNAGAERIYGYTAAEAIGRSITLLVPPDQAGEEVQILDQIKRGEPLQHYETRRIREDGQIIDVSLTISPIHDTAGRLIGASTIARDITEQKRAALALRRQTAFVQMLQDIAVAANETPSLVEALRIAVERICTHIGWPVGHVYLADEQGTQILRSSNIWYLADPARYAIFQKITEALVFPGMNDLPARVLVSGLPEWVTDLRLGSSIPRAKLIQDIGVRAGFAFPVLVGAEVAAVLEFFSPDPVEPDGALLDVMANIGTQLGRVVERARADAALRNSEERYRLIAENTGDIITLLDTEARQVYVSPSIRNLLGYDPAALIGHSVFDLIHPEDRPLIARQWQSSTHTDAVQLALRCRHADGSWRWLEVHGTAMEQHGVYYTLIISRDITARRQAEEALRAAETRYRTLVEQIPAIVYTARIDDLSSTLYVSPQIEPILGYAPQEWMANPSLWYDRIHPDDRAGVLDAVRRAQRSDVPLPNEHRSYTRDGRLVWLQDAARVVRDEAGQPLFLQGITLDITERKLAEEALRASERLYRTLASNFPNGAVILFDHDLRFTIADGARLAAHGLSRELVEGRTLWEVFAPERVAVLEPIYRAVLAGESRQIELETQGYVYEAFFLPVRDEQGAIFAGLIVSQDITERKHAEQALVEERALLARRVQERTADLSAANAELARAARLKDEFLASMSHELRTPLNAILGLSEALQEEVYGPLSERQIKSLHSIEESGHHLLDLINDILDLAKIGAGKLELEIAPAAIGPVCEASLRMIRQSALKKQLTIETSIDPAATAVPIDTRRIKQALVNLLSNAVKFTPEGGSIGLEVTADRARQTVHLAVWDTGIGIAADQLPKLFQPFVQLDSRLARQYEGTGLGLALVYRMVELHGGGIEVSSTAGAGSRFAISLPWPSGEPGRDLAATPNAPAEAAYRLAGQPSTPAPAEPAEHIPPLVLLAEDNEANIATITDYLCVSGYQVVVARNGAEAIARAHETRPKIILMDMQMPEMDGLDATQRLHSDQELSGIPIIALTALAMPGDRERCLAAGAVEYFSKPVSLRALVAVLDSYLQNQSR
jgi:PAS domain S-box-containing protein